MTQEEKQLLLKDLSARLMYGVICQVDDGAAGLNDGKLIEIDISKEIVRFDANYYWDAYIDDVKPYLRPMSSMTEREKTQMAHDCYVISLDFEYTTTDMVALWNTPRVINWLLEHHFDYRGLIEKGLAIAVTEENNPYK